jgi:hypothetical protein
MNEPVGAHPASQPPATVQRQEPRQPRQESRQESRQPRHGRKDDHRRTHRPAASVTSIDEARPKRSPQPAPARTDDGDTSHLPAFLLRPVTLKA